MRQTVGEIEQMSTTDAAAYIEILIEMFSTEKGAQKAEDDFF